MLRARAAFIVLCMVLIAACAGTVLYLLAGLSGAESLVVAIAVLTGLAVYNAVSTRRPAEPGDVGGQVADLSQQTIDLVRRITVLEDRARRNADGTEIIVNNATAPITAELGELGTLIKQLAETVAQQELEFANRSDTATIRSTDEAAPTPPAANDAPIAVAPAGSPILEDDRLEMVRDAIDADRIDAYLQPIVTLPQRKTRFYEGLTRLRSKTGLVLEPPDFIDAAEACGLMAKIDTTMLLRSAQLVRRPQLKSRETTVFCNIAASTLNDPVVFPELVQFFDTNRTVAPSLVLEFTQDLFRDMGPLEMESLAALRDIGFQFCVDHVTDLRIEPRELADRGIRYIKIPAPVLLDAAGGGQSDIHAADFSNLLARFGVNLIADRIETESQVVELLEYGIRFGQGFLFSTPRPVKMDMGAGDAGGQTDRNAADVRPKRAAGGSGRAF